MSNYWPGTSILKSKSNAFTAWKKEGSIMTNDRTHLMSASGTKSRKHNDSIPAHMQIYKGKK